MSKSLLSIALALAFFAAAPSAGAQHDHGGHGAHGGHEAHGAVQTNPADGAMGAAPESFSAVFEHPMRLTSLVITPRGGDPIAVAVAEAQAAATASIELPPLAPGHYTFAWTAIGEDNHTMTGRVRYMVH